MPHQVVKVRRDAVAPCMTCPICRKLLRDATTIIECLHTFCWKCIYKKISDEEMECCPLCKIDLGCLPLEKLRPDHNMQDVRSKIFPYKRINVKAREAETTITLPAKRKKRSLSSLVVSTPRVSTHNGMTGRRSKSITRKASKGTRFTIEKPVKKEDSREDHPESSGSPETLNKFTQNARQTYATGEPSTLPSPDRVRDDGSKARDGKLDLWKPLNCLVEVANRSKSSTTSVQASASKSEALDDNEELFSRTNSTKKKEQRQKSKVQVEKNFSDSTPPETERPKRLRRIHPKKPRNFGELRFSSQGVLDAASAEVNRSSCPIWFSLVSNEQDGNVLPLPQISASYLRLKDGNMPVSFIQKYLKLKLALSSEDEVEIKLMGQPVIPTLTLSNLFDLWVRTTTSDRVSATVGSSAKEFVMVLGYARKVPFA